MINCRICGKETIHPRFGMGKKCAQDFAAGKLPILKAKNLQKVELPLLKLEKLEKFTGLELIGEEVEGVGLSANNLGEYITTLCYGEDEKSAVMGARRGNAVFHMLKDYGIIPEDSTMAAITGNTKNLFNTGMIAFYPHEDPRPEDDMVFINLFDFDVDLDKEGQPETYLPFFREYGIITSKGVMFIHNGSYIGNYHLGKNNYFFNSIDTAPLEDTVKKVKERNLGEVDHSKNPHYFFESQEIIEELRQKAAGFVFFRNFVRKHANTMSKLQKELENTSVTSSNSVIDLSYSNITMIRQVYIQYIFKMKEDGLDDIQVDAIQRSFEIPILRASFNKEEIELVHDYLESDGGESFYYEIMKTGKK